MFRRAVLEDLVASNPVPLVDKPSQRRTREPKLVAPAKVEEMRAWLLNNPHRRYARDRQLDATLLSLLAYAGLRPESKALALRWEDVRERVLFVPAGRKRGARDRTVRLLAPLRDDLEAGRRIVEADGSGHVFGEWSGERWDGWRGRVYREAAKVAELPADARPRDLRGSFASLLIAEGQSVLEVARQLGHSPATCLRRLRRAVRRLRPCHAHRSRGRSTPDPPRRPAVAIVPGRYPSGGVRRCPCTH